MKPRLLAQLDRRLERKGDIVTLWRNFGTPFINSVSVDLPGFVKGLTVEQLIGNITQQTYFVIISPTHLLQKHWPGGSVPTTSLSAFISLEDDTRMPTTNDKIYVRYAQRAISRVVPVFDTGQCVRIEITATG